MLRIPELVKKFPADYEKAHYRIHNSQSLVPVLSHINPVPPPSLNLSNISINLLKPTGHYMYHQFNIQQLYALPTLYLCVLCLSENKQRLVPLTA